MNIAFQVEGVLPPYLEQYVLGQNHAREAGVVPFRAIEQQPEPLLQDSLWERQARLYRARKGWPERPVHGRQILEGVDWFRVNRLFHVVVLDD